MFDVRLILLTGQFVVEVVYNVCDFTHSEWMSAKARCKVNVGRESGKVRRYDLRYVAF